MKNSLAVIAFGGNAILKEHERGTQEEQIRHCDEAADLMAQIVQRGYDYSSFMGMDHKSGTS
jgi:carbamate kinase